MAIKRVQAYVDDNGNAHPNIEDAVAANLDKLCFEHEIEDHREFIQHLMNATFRAKVLAQLEELK